MSELSKDAHLFRPRKGFERYSKNMRSRVFRPIAVLLSVLLLVHTPAQAGPVTLGDVMQIIGNYQKPSDLRIRTSQPFGSPQQGEIHPDSLLSGVVMETGTTQDPVKIVVAEPGEVDGTLCDCGFVTVAAGFPKWPLLFLAAVPLFFITDDDCDDCDKVNPSPTPTPTPTPTPPPQTPVPEPASLLLFGTGLAAVGARLRRRRMKAKSKPHGETTEG